jgi:hypothetical protein
MPSDTEICNKALAKIGTRSDIASLDEDSNEARACSLIYATTRDEVLSMAHWNFAKRTATLSLIKSAPGTPSNPTGATQWSNAYPAPPWLYEYAYPADCEQFRYIVPQIDTGIIGVPLFSTVTGYSPFVGMPWNAVRFEIASDIVSDNNQNVILTNQYQAIGVYTYQVTNTALFSNNFTEALACALAAKLAQPLTGDRALRNEMFQLANVQITSARASDGNEGLTIIDAPADWITARDSFSPMMGQGYFIAPYAPLFPVGM